MSDRLLVTSKKVIDRVKSTLQINHSNWIGFAVEEIGYGIQSIGYHTGFIEKPFDLCVVNNCVEIPSVIVGIKAIEYYGRRLPLAQDLTSSKLAKQDTSQKSTKASTEEFKELEKLINQFNNLIAYEAANGIEEEDAKTNLLNKIKNYQERLKLTNKEMDTNQVESYYINDNKILTTFETGEITLYATLIAVDREGFPMVRKEYNYQEALFWYITQKLILRGYVSPAGITFVDALSLYEKHRQKASNDAKLDLNKMENLSRLIGRYVHNASLVDKFFKDGINRTQL